MKPSEIGPALVFMYGTSCCMFHFLLRLEIFAGVLMAFAARQMSGVSIR